MAVISTINFTIERYVYTVNVNMKADEWILLFAV